MAASDSSRFRNKLLLALPSDALALLELARVELPRRTSLETPNRRIAHVYFPDSGIASIVASPTADAQVEVGIVGRDGMTGVAIVHGADRSPHAVYMQVDGAGHRAEAAAVAAAMERHPECRRIFLAFAQALMLQISETAVANVRATIGERLARWLLMVQDRVGGSEIPLTHEFLALMMGARRPGVTEAIHELSRHGLIAGARGKVVILDRPGLEEHAGRYYGIPERELRRLLG